MIYYITHRIKEPFPRTFQERVVLNSCENKFSLATDKKNKLITFRVCLRNR